MSLFLNLASSNLICSARMKKRELAALRQELTSRKETALQASREIDALQKSRQEFNEILGRLQEIRKKL